MSARSILFASLAVVVFTLACSEARDTATAQTAVPIPVVTIVATDYAYEAPDTVPAGFVVFRLVNRGNEGHSAAIVHLEDGRTLPEYLDVYAEANRTRSARPTWATFLGGPAALTRGEASATIRLEPGNYAIVCFVPGPDGILHILKHKQAHAFVVSPPADDVPAPRAPEANASLRMLDYGFELSEPLEHGKQVIRIENVGVDYHHILLFKLAPGKTLADFQAWMQNDMQGEAPSTLAGMMDVLSRSHEAYLELDLPAGEYVLVCLVAGLDEIPHIAKGMIQQIRVE